MKIRSLIFSYMKCIVVCSVVQVLIKIAHCVQMESQKLMKLLWVVVGGLDSILPEFKKNYRFLIHLNIIGRAHPNVFNESFV